jgi:hypothetical protein
MELSASKAGGPMTEESGLEYELGVSPGFSINYNAACLSSS